MGVLKRPKLKKAETADGHEYYYSRRPYSRRANVKNEDEQPTPTRASARADQKATRQRKRS